MLRCDQYPGDSGSTELMIRKKIPVGFLFFSSENRKCRQSHSNQIKNMSVSTKKLTALRDYFLAGGSQETEDVLKQLGTDDEAVLDEYVVQLKAKWPKEFDPENYVEEKVEEAEVEFTFWIKNDDNTLTELEKFKDKNSKIIFITKEPRDEVEIIIAGKLTTVDLFKLLKSPVENAKKIMAAELAKG